MQMRPEKASMDSNTINRRTERFPGNLDQFFTEDDLLRQNRQTNKDAVHIWYMYMSC